MLKYKLQLSCSIIFRLLLLVIIIFNYENLFAQKIRESREPLQETPSSLGLKPGIYIDVIPTVYTQSSFPVSDLIKNVLANCGTYCPTNSVSIVKGLLSIKNGVTNSVYSTSSTFSWVTSNSSSVVFGRNTLTPIVNLAGTYFTIIGTCIEIASTSVIVNKTLPTVSLNLNRLKICSEQSVTLTANGASSYTWIELNGKHFAPNRRFNHNDDLQRNRNKCERMIGKLEKNYQFSFKNI